MARARKSAPSLLVHEVMTPEPVSLPASATVQQAAARMRDKGVGAIIVTEGDAMCGLVTDRDIVVRCVANGNDCGQTSLAEICSQDDLATVSPDDEIARAIELMRAKSVRRLPVIDHDRPVGILSLGDLALSRDPHSVLAEISAASSNR